MESDFPGGAVVKNLPANAVGSTPGSVKFPGGEMVTQSSILASFVKDKVSTGVLIYL